MKSIKKQHLTKEKKKKQRRKQSFEGVYSRILLSILTGLCSFNGMNPLAPSFFMAASRKGVETILLWVCTTGSIYIRLGMEAAIKYGAVMGVSYFLSKMGQAVFQQEIHKKAIITGVVTTALTFSELLWMVDVGMVAFEAVTEGFMTLGLIILLSYALNYENHRQRFMEQEELLGWILLLSGFVYGIEFPANSFVSIRQVVVWFLVLYFAYRFGMAEGALVGICLGSVLYYQKVAVSFGTASAFYSAGFFALCAIAGGIVRKAGRIATLCSMSGVALLLFRWAQDLRVENWYAFLIGGVLFLILPTSVLSLANQEVLKGSMEEILAMQVRNQLKGFAEVFKRIKLTLLFSNDDFEKMEQKEQIVEHTVQEVCSQCEYHMYCWDTEAKLSYEQVGAVMEQVELVDDIEEVYDSPFLGRCPKQSSFLTELRHGIAMNKLEMIYNERILEGREAMAGQFEQVARLIDDLFVGSYQELPISDKEKIQLEVSLKAQKIKLFEIFQFKNTSGQKEIYMTLCSERGRMLTARELTKLVGRAFGYSVRSKRGNRSIVSKKKECYGFIEESQFYYLQGVGRVSKTTSDVSGDNFSILEYDMGKLGVMLADGMGSGRYASKKSALLVELMEQLLEAGFSKDASLRLLNAVLVTPVSDANFSTLDLCMIDLYKGVYQFYKVGGSASFIKRSNQVEMIQGGAIPVGIFPNLEYEFYETNVQDGDMLFLLSDGVMESVPCMDKEKFIANEIQKIQFANPQTAAAKLMSRVQELGGMSNRDDITILVVGIWNRV